MFGIGGNFGDCATYHGLGGVGARGRWRRRLFQVDSGRGESQGAVWMGGARTGVDAGGNIWVERGNGSVYSPSRPYDDSDSVLELSSALTLTQYFAPVDLGSENAPTSTCRRPGPAVGRPGRRRREDRIAYLLDGAHLGGIGGEQSCLGRACRSDIDGGPAVVGTTVFCPA